MQHDSRNISMLMDFYEMTMAHGYLRNMKTRIASRLMYSSDAIQTRVALPFLVVLNKSLSTF